ncbi:MAG: aminotransferase class V-fold PLP-dependent enzyme [Oscillospiraceae bacterium]|nr:aminotransferase class V-fold PLP-dependent enzyme [Oscillospiraceae bacterium]
MIYLDNGATSYPKPAPVRHAVLDAMLRCANPGRGGYGAAMEAARRVYDCREAASQLFDCDPEQVVLTSNCTHGLNIAIRTLVKPGSRVVVSGFEHNAVTRPLYALGAKITVAGHRLFDQENTLEEFEAALRAGAKAAIFTHVSNVFGYILPVEELGRLCKKYAVPFVVDAAQSAGAMDISLRQLGADFIAMPGHKGLLGPQGTGLLLCAGVPEPLLYGGTGSDSVRQDMPQQLPERAEAGTVNVPGIAGLTAGLRYVHSMGAKAIGLREQKQARAAAQGLKSLGIRVFSGAHQAGTVSFLPAMDCEELAQRLAQRGIAVRAGLHCAPLAHKSAGTLGTGTVRISFGHRCDGSQTQRFLREMAALS